MLAVGQSLHDSFGLESVLSTLAAHFQSVTGARQAAVWLADDNDIGVLRRASSPVVAAADLRGWVQSRVWTAGQQPLWLDRVDNKSEWAALLPGGDNEGCLVVVPLVAQGEFLGLLAGTGGSAAARHGSGLSFQDRNLLTFLANYAAVTVQNERLQARQRRGADRQRLLDHISGYLQQTLDLDVLIPRIFDEVNNAINAEAQSIWLLDEEAGVIACRFATGPGAEIIKKVAVPVGEGIVGSTVLRQESLLIADAQQDLRHSRIADRKTGLVTHSLMSVPMVRAGKSIGGIQAINKQNGALFNQDDLDLLRGIADIAAMAIENARLYAELEQSYNSTLDALTAALDLRDRETEGHSRRVVAFTARLAEELNLDPDTIKTLRRGALLHDIGKIGVPDAVLRKPGLLSPDERAVIERHPLTGFEMLLGIPHLDEEIRVVLAHQEKWDGTGYPFGLSGEAIPLGARVFAVADTFDAILSDRPYRAGRTYAEARRIIAEEAGRQFDPQVVAAFLAIAPEEWDDLRRAVLQDIQEREAAHTERIAAERRSEYRPAPTGKKA